MKRLLAILLVLAMCFCVAACGDQGGSAGDKEAVIEWKMGSAGADPAMSLLSSYSEFMTKFVELVNERSDGRLVITPYYNSILGGDVQMMNDCRDGNLEVYRGNPLSGIDSRFGFKAMPYLFSDYDQVEELMCSPDGGLFLMMKEILKDHNCELVGMGHGTFRGLVNTKHPVKTVDDVKDLTIRIYEDPTVNAFWTPLCNAQPLPWNDLYTALQTGVVDGAEMASNIVISSKNDEVVKYFSEIQWQWVGSFTIINADAFNALPDDLKEIVVECSWEAGQYENEMEEKYREEAHRMLEERNVEVYIPTEEEMQTWIDYAHSVAPKIREIVGGETFDKAMKIVDESNEKRN